MDKPESTLKKIKEGLEELNELPAEDRISIYDSLSNDRYDYDYVNGNVGIDLLFDRESVEINGDGIVVKKEAKVFLSHSQKDKKLARVIYEYLKGENILVWFDEAELCFGDSLISKITEAIDTVDILIALISKESVNSEWVNREIEMAMTQEIHSKQVKVIPVLCDYVPLPGFLMGKFYVDFTTEFALQKNLPKLSRDIKIHNGDILIGGN